jgi:hypothetical protein
MLRATLSSASWLLFFFTAGFVAGRNQIAQDFKFT